MPEAGPRSFRRIAVVGNSGSGKSRLAGEIARMLDLPLIHLDQHYWRAGWQALPKDEWRATHRRLIEQPAWVIDGHFGGTLGERLAKADAVVFLDLPVWLCLWRALKRVARSYGRVRADMAPGCPEQIDLAFIVYVLGWRRSRRPAALALIEAARDRIALVRIRRGRDIAAMWPVLGVTPPR